MTNPRLPSLAVLVLMSCGPDQKNIKSITIKQTCESDIRAHYKAPGLVLQEIKDLRKNYSSPHTHENLSVEGHFTFLTEEKGMQQRLRKVGVNYIPRKILIRDEERNLIGFNNGLNIYETSRAGEEVQYDLETFAFTSELTDNSDTPQNHNGETILVTRLEVLDVNCDGLHDIILGSVYRDKNGEYITLADKVYINEGDGFFTHTNGY